MEGRGAHDGRSSVVPVFEKMNKQIYKARKPLCAFERARIQDLFPALDLACHGNSSFSAECVEIWSQNPKLGLAGSQ